ncbi:MAG: hypothetical protein HRU34_04505 [Richelia sp.]|nr:hypothetical protein [Richelia sp.]CDN14761.1 hypothetical protein RintRC_5951 [Richelia intracellularis]
MLFAIGLQASWLGSRSVPMELKTLIVNATEITNSQKKPGVWWSLGLFPYVIFMLGATDRLYRNKKRRLGLFGEQLSLFVGVILTTLALVNTLR